MNHYKFFCVNLRNLNPSLSKVCLLLIFIWFVAFGAVSPTFAVVDIDKETEILCPELGDSDPNRILQFSLTSSSTPKDDNVSWSIFPSGSGTDFLFGDTGTDVFIEFASTPSVVYTLTVSEPGGSMDRLTIVVGPTARIVSFIEEFTASELFLEVFTEAFDVLGLPALLLSGSILAGLEGLSSVANNENPSPTFNDSTWSDYVSRKEYRGYLYLQPVAFFDFDTSALLCSGLIKNEVSHGFTPPPLPIRVTGGLGYDPGEPNIPTITPPNPSADRTINSQRGNWTARTTSFSQIIW